MVGRPSRGRSCADETDAKGGGGRPPLGPRLVAGFEGDPPHLMWGGLKSGDFLLSSADVEPSPWQPHRTCRLWSMGADSP